MSTPHSVPQFHPPPPQPHRVAIRRQRRRILPWLLAWVAAVAVVGAVVALVLFGSPGSARAARRVADREVQMTLEPGERVEGSAHVAQRHALDYFRETYGTLAATDRRLIFIGVLPRDFLEPERDLPAFDVQTFLYDTSLAMRGARVFRGRAFGVVLHDSAGNRQFGVTRAEWPRVQQVMRHVNARVLAVQQSVERERTAIAEAAARPPVRDYHTVKRGESLIAIARLYETTPESLLVLNALPDSSIRAGQSLLVREYRDTTVSYRDTLMPGRRP
jgi:hypothetical protein